MAKVLLICFFVLGVVSPSLSAQKNLDIIYATSDYQRIAEYFRNDIMLVSPSTQTINVRLDPRFPYSRSLKDWKEPEEAFLIYPFRHWIGVRYINTETQKDIFYRFNKKGRERRISIYSVENALKVRVPLVKKKIVLFLFRNMASDQYGFIGELLPTSLGNALLSTENVQVEFSYLNERVLADLQIREKTPSKENVSRIVNYFKANAGIIGSFVVLKDKIRVNIFALEKGRMVFSIQREMPLSKQLFYTIDQIAMEVNRQIIRHYPPEPPSVIVVEKEKKVIVHQEVTAPIKEEKKGIEKLLPEEGLSIKELFPATQHFSDEIRKPEEPKKSEKKKQYAKGGTVEIGGMIWGDFSAFKSGSVNQQVWFNQFFSVFLTDSFLMGVKGELQYNLESSQYVGAAYWVAGGFFPLFDGFYMGLTLNLGYSQNNFTAKKYLSYSNEFSFKIRLKGNFLMGLGAIYHFYNDMDQKFFYDKICGFISFSGYF